MAETLTREERAAVALQACMNWPEAERCAADLEAAGVLESGNEAAAVDVLAGSMTRDRAERMVRMLTIRGSWVAAPARGGEEKTS